MVYQGKPSAGCANCRKRKIKCDEKTPACSQCTNTKRQCPGYIARFDLILRDQTNAVRRKAQRKKQTQSSPKKSNFDDSLSVSQDALANANEAAPSSAMKRPTSADHNLASSKMFNDFPEQQAICAFFLDFVLLPRHSESVRGHLEHLLPLYSSASPDSPLSLATSSVALVMSEGSRVRQSNQQLGRSIFGRALRKTSAAIRDPVESVKDETLMAVLLLGLFERIKATAKTSKSNMTDTHNKGAAAIVMHRGKENCKSPLSVGLLFAVRTQLAEHAIEEGTSFKRCPDSLTTMFESLPQNASARLTSATINIADLRSCAKSALLLPHTASSEKEVSDLLEYAISIDLLVTAWADTVPADWSPTPATAFDLPPPPWPPAATFIYSPRHDLYLDLWVLSIWNQYRAARIKIQSLILTCIAYLGPAHDPHWYWRAVYAKMIVQEMSDDICASVPFALGTKAPSPGPAPAVVEFPYLAGQPKLSDDHRRAAGALGGWHLLDPLKACVRAGGLREGQAEWMAAQLERIGRIYALQGFHYGDGDGEGEGGMWDRSSYEFPV